MKIYCAKCKQPTNYTEFRPKFCANCGHGFSNIILPTPIAQASQRTNVVSEPIQEETIEHLQINNIQPFKVQVLSNLRNTEKIENVVNEKPTNKSKSLNKRAKPQRISKENFTKQWKEEMGNRPRTEIQGDDNDE